MPSQELALRVKVEGRELFLPAGDTLEVIALEYVLPFPAQMYGLSGIVFNHGQPVPVLDWGLFGSEEGAAPLVAILKRRLAVPIQKVFEIRDIEALPLVGLKRGDPLNPILGHRRKLSGHAHGVLNVEKLLGLLHNRSFRR